MLYHPFGVGFCLVNLVFYNLGIPSGLKTINPLNHLKTEAMCRFGLEFLFDGYLIKLVENSDKLLITKDYLFDGH